MVVVVFGEVMVVVVMVVVIVLVGVGRETVVRSEARKGWCRWRGMVGAGGGTRCVGESHGAAGSVYVT